MADKKLNLSRRNVLAGLGTIGLASAGAGIGTTAYFNDTESFTDNTLTAGSLDLAVQATVYEYQAEANEGGQTFGPVVINGENGVSQQLTDVKPGDYSYGMFCFSLVDNPGYIWAGGELTANDENTVNEPEADDDPNNSTESSTPIEGEGELADAIEVTLYCVEDGYVPDDQGRPSENASIPAAGDAELVFEGSLREVLAALSVGLPLDSDPETDGRQPFPGSVEQDFSGKCLAFAWELPTEVGNEVQSDSVEFDLTFYAVQARHNDGSANPFVDEFYMADYQNPDGIAQPIPGGKLLVGVDYGTSDVTYTLVFDETASSTGHSLMDPNFASTNFSMPFEANTDDSDDVYDFQVAWDPDAGFPDAPLGYASVDSTPSWQSWSALPSGYSITKLGNVVTVVIPRSDLDAGTTDAYVFGVNASAGGEQPTVSVPAGGPYSSNQNFTSSENGQPSTLQ